jgi:hypothetical protein
MAPKPQGQGEMTFQADVGPGDVTGVYYITICNVSGTQLFQKSSEGSY